MTDEIYYGGECEIDSEGHAVVYAPAKNFWRWFDDFAQPYAPLLTTLSDEFGATFSLSHTGGGCMAIEATLENRVTIMITDAEDVLDRDNWDGRYGYTVGVYPLLPCECWLPAAVEFVDGEPMLARWEWTNDTSVSSHGQHRRVVEPFIGPLREKCSHPDSADTCAEAIGYAFSKDAKSPAQLIELIKIALLQYPASGERTNDMREVPASLLPPE